MPTTYIKEQEKINIPEVVIISPLKLRIDGLNPNKMNDAQKKALKLNIEKYGFLIPIITNKDYLIADGQHRWEVAKSLGMKEIPVIVLDVEEVDRRMLRQIMNKLRGTHELDLDAEEFKFISDSGNMDEFNQLSDIALKDINAAMDSLNKVNEDDFDIDSAAKEPKYKIEIGEVWELGNHRLMCGDATDFIHVKGLIELNTVNLVLTDPPYGVSIVSKETSTDGGGGKTHFKGRVGGGNIVKATTYSEVIGDDTTDTARLSYEILKEVSELQILWGGNYFTDFLKPSRCWIVWNKKYEQHSSNTFADVELAWCSKDANAKIYSCLWRGLLKEGEHGKRVHPTQKPIKLISDILKDFTKENENVLDVFGGSGSTLIACEQLKRKCYMMEIDPKYCSVIIERWETLTGKKARRVH